MASSVSEPANDEMRLTPCDEDFEPQAKLANSENNADRAGRLKARQ
jgi:hypothetical protein